MKNYFLILMSLSSFLSYSQIDSTKTLAISINGNYPIAFGSTFLNKGFKATSGFGIEMQGNTKHYLFGIGFRRNNYKIVNTSLIGDFDKANDNNPYFFGGYRFYIKNTKCYLENKVGYGFNMMYHKSALSEYKLTGNSFFIGSKINYKYTPDINFFLGSEFCRNTYNIKIIGPYEKFYSRANQFIPSIGLKLLLGTSTK